MNMGNSEDTDRSELARAAILKSARAEQMARDSRLLTIRFTFPAGMNDDEIHDMASRIAANVSPDEPVTFDSADVTGERP